MPALRRSVMTAIGIFLAASAAWAQGSTGLAAEVNGSPIMTADVDSKIAATLAKLQDQMFSVRQKQLQVLIDQKLLEDAAAKKGVTIAAMIQSEITARVTPPTADEVAKFYEENKSGLTGDFKSLEEQIKNFLMSQRLNTRQQEFLQSLRAAAKINVLLTPPPIYRATVSTDGAPVRGAGDAPVTIVEFSDFHCPFCRKVQPVLDQLRAKYGNQIKLVFRDFPLDNLHPQATTVSQAARCATEQGKFWEFHDQVFANGPDATQATLDGFAKNAGMDVASFNACRAASKYNASIAASLQEGGRLGITGTPTFFVNGRILVGSQPLEEFVRVIEEELALRKSPPPVASR
jgi:protein-disulfide isomerase